MKASGRSGGQAEADGRVPRHARHGRDVREVHGQRLAAEQVRRRPVAAEVHALDHAVGGDERERARSRPRPRRRRCRPRRPGPGGCASAGGASSARSPSCPTVRSGLGHARASSVAGRKAPRLCRVEGDLNLVTRWDPCAPLQASSTRRHAHHGATAEPRIKDVGSRLPDPSRSTQGTLSTAIIASRARPKQDVDRAASAVERRRERRAPAPRPRAPQLARRLVQPAAQPEALVGDVERGQDGDAHGVDRAALAC